MLSSWACKQIWSAWSGWLTEIDAAQCTKLVRAYIKQLMGGDIHHSSCWSIIRSATAEAICGLSLSPFIAKDSRENVCPMEQWSVWLLQQLWTQHHHLFSTLLHGWESCRTGWRELPHLRTHSTGPHCQHLFWCQDQRKGAWTERHWGFFRERPAPPFLLLLLRSHSRSKWN